MTGFSAAVRTTIRQRSDFICEVCGYTVGSEVHHRRARGAGGTKQPESNEASNGLYLCRDCHRLIESHRNLAARLGWLVSQYDNPADVPVVYRGRPVILDDLGNMREVA